MEKHDRVLSVEKKTDNRFLNMYDIQYENKVGGQGIYHIASRASSVETLKMKTRVNRPDGVIIYALYAFEKRQGSDGSPVPVLHRRLCL